MASSRVMLTGSNSVPQVSSTLWRFWRWWLLMALNQSIVQSSHDYYAGALCTTFGWACAGSSGGLASQQGKRAYPARCT